MDFHRHPLMWEATRPSLPLKDSGLLPKKTSPQQPENFSSILVTLANEIPVSRELAQSIDESIQRAFTGGIDGCCDCIVLLDTILRSRYNGHKSLHMATLDTMRASDSVQHSALKAVHMPPNYLLSR